MSIEPRPRINPFESPIKTIPPCAPADVPCSTTQQPDVLATADLLLGQLKELENLCATVEERVQRKRHALKELEYLVVGSNAAGESLSSPACPVNTPTSSRLYLLSPRLRGLFDLHGPAQANLDAVQSCLDYSPEGHAEDNLSTCEDAGHSDGWADEDEEALLCPFDDTYAVRGSPRKAEKVLPAIPRARHTSASESKIPRKACVRRQVSASRRLTGRSSGAVTRATSSRRRSSVRSVKGTGAVSHLKTKGTMRRGSWKRSILENVKAKGGAKMLPAAENETTDDGARRKEKRKGLWSIYSVCSELGLNVTQRAA